MEGFCRFRSLEKHRNAAGLVRRADIYRVCRTASFDRRPALLCRQIEGWGPQQYRQTKQAKAFHGPQCTAAPALPNEKEKGHKKETEIFFVSDFVPFVSFCAFCDPSPIPAILS